MWWKKNLSPIDWLVFTIYIEEFPKSFSLAGGEPVGWPNFCITLAHLLYIINSMERFHQVFSSFFYWNTYLKTDATSLPVLFLIRLLSKRKWNFWWRNFGVGLRLTYIWVYKNKACFYQIKCLKSWTYHKTTWSKFVLLICQKIRKVFS